MLNAFSAPTQAPVLAQNSFITTDSENETPQSQKPQFFQSFLFPLFYFCLIKIQK